VDAGRIHADEARVHPQRNIVTRVLGSLQPPEAEYWLFAPEVGERYLLCSDGLCGELGEYDIARLMADIHDPGVAASTLVREAIAAGGSDNATAIVIDVWDGATAELEIDPHYRSADDELQRGRGGHRIDRPDQVEQGYVTPPPVDDGMIHGVPYDSERSPHA
jgi:serine/threonine protein phosphatase PrpC